MLGWKQKVLPVIPLRGMIVFPNTVVDFDAGRHASLRALEEVYKNDDEKLCIAILQRDACQVDVQPSDLHKIGTLISLQETLEVPGKAIHVVAKGIQRVKILRFRQKEGVIRADVAPIESELDDDIMQKANSREILRLFEQYQTHQKQEIRSVWPTLRNDLDLQIMIDRIAGSIDGLQKERYEILKEENLIERSFLLMKLLQDEIDIRFTEEKIQKKVHDSMEQINKNYYLREQIRVLTDELGEENSVIKEAESYREKVNALQINKKEKQYILREINRYAILPQGSHEMPPLRAWIENVLALPWDVYTEDNYDLNHAKIVLDTEHYGLDKIKERILEHLAVCKLRGTTKGTIFCLYGPPGVGKTSIAASVAKAMDRNFVRVSLGGVHDEAEIRGHRRTYIGAMPGRIIQGMKQAGSMNPVILLDEIDKISISAQGDPASALLEVLDPGQNDAFRDHYLEMPFDLSKCMFIVTANNLTTIPTPLLDRLEIVELYSYTIEEKVEIAERFLLKKQMQEHALPDHSVYLSRKAIEELVTRYTREAGVRGLERNISEICRKVALQIVLNERERVVLSKRNLEKVLGIPRYLPSTVKNSGEVGIVNGLAWTSIGGEILCVEAMIMCGSGRLHLTGQMGDVMKESAHIAFTYLKSNAAQWNLNIDDMNQVDVHIHMPEGAIPKDGPSAGITLAIALISAFTGRKVRSNIAMTGEITLRGLILPVGGIKEKIIAAQREGIKTVILPRQNQMHVSQLPNSVQKSLHFEYVESVDEVVAIALEEAENKKEKNKCNEILPINHSKARKAGEL